MPTYVRTPYAPDQRSMLDLMRLAAADRSRSDTQKAAIRTAGILNLGQLIAGTLASIREDRTQQAMNAAAMQKQQRDEAFRTRDQELREAEFLARTDQTAQARAEAQRKDAEARAAQAYTRGEKLASDLGPGPMSEMDVDPVMAGPAAGRVRYAFGPGTAEGPELQPTRAQAEEQGLISRLRGMGYEIGPNGQVVGPPTKPQPNQWSLALEAAKGDPSKALELVREQQPPPAPAKPNYMWAKDPQSGVTRLMSEEEIRRSGASQPDTADMRNKASGKRVAGLAVEAVRNLSKGIFTKVGPAQRMAAIERGAEAVFGTDPEFRTYQDSRMALAGTLAVEQQGGRVSDADVKALWLPMVPDAYRDTKESYDLKWKLIDAMRGIESPSSGSGAPQVNSILQRNGKSYRVTKVYPDGTFDADEVKK